MVLDFKCATLLVGLFVAIIVVFLFMYEYLRLSSVAVINPLTLSDPSLKFAVVIFRHGNRAGVLKCKENPFANAFPEGPSQLTKKGKQNMYRKGQIIRRLYNGYLNDLYLDSEIIMKTTNTTRTYMSAAMVLAGMYPPRNYQKWSEIETVWQPIPIYWNSPDHGTLFLEQGRCPTFDKILKISFSEIMENEELLNYLSDKCGKKIKTENLREFHDYIKILESNGLNSQEWFTSEKLKDIEFAIEKENISKLFENIDFSKHLVGPLLKEIGLDIKLRLDNYHHNTTRKMHLYSGHDISLFTIMHIFGQKIDKLVDYGSSLHFHLYLDKINGYIIKMFYFERWDDVNGIELNMTHIPDCNNKPCKIQDFIAFVTNHFSGNWEEECRLTSN